VKGLLLPAVMATAIHILILGLDMKWTGRISHPVSSQRMVTLALTYLSPEREVIPPMPRTLETDHTPMEKNAVLLKKEKASTIGQRHVPKPTVESPKAEDQGPALDSLPARSEPFPGAVPGTGEQQTEMNPPHGAAVPDTNAKTSYLSSAPVLQEAFPTYRKNPHPGYPYLARRRGLEGTVLLEALVSPQGKVKDLRVSQSSGHEMLDQAALGAVRGWVFEPGKRGDDPVEMWVRVPIRFELK